MNVSKVAVFVEGQAEHIFVREMLLKWYNYDCNKLGIDCYFLKAGEDREAPYSWGSHDSEHYFQIVNVGNDNSVLSTMLKRADGLKNAGFSLLLGLRDMFCDNYHKAAQSRMIRPDINARFMASHQKQIDDKGCTGFIRFHFAIMEVEAWLLGMPGLLTRVDGRLTDEWIKDECKYDMASDPEISCYHPAAVLDKIYGSIGLSYDKHEGDISKITSCMDNGMVEGLLMSWKCSSFKTFVADLMI